LNEIAKNFLNDDSMRRNFFGKLFLVLDIIANLLFSLKKN